MRIALDTNVLLRAVTGDDEAQQQLALEALESADVVAVSVLSLCEFAWVMARGYRASRDDIAGAIRRIVDLRNVATDRPAVEAGLAVLEAGGDFADGVIAHEGRWLGGETFVSFDVQAVRLLAEAGQAARLLHKPG
ncbi:MAG: type II toxin-antitoxin system VapC family toxin [Brevundimonas sp.]|uniref:type II toxin-antitoxin system VapC family toxin n=1 Tax=Brevundimonas sp. TaxID=1871086 RepID=UPI0025873FDC|nr:type II toxin-antitoxin system VapC family toxin [Brevundimonas sp.]MCV0414425.1 type II toxin-antitoxin system VapC family toxin [Brevundimonas sp.]